jgi:heat shock protein HslJ
MKLLSGFKLLLTAFVLTGILVIASKSICYSQGTHSSQTSLDWMGTYRGTLPCANCEGIYTELTLNKNKTYDLITRRIGKGDMGVKALSGSFTWNKAGTTVILGGINKETQPTQYVVGENTLTQLDLQGKPIDGDLAERYILKKGPPSIEEKYWKLATLYGNAATPEKGDRKEAHIILKAEGNRLSGSGGCNTISGDYVLSEGNGIKFSKLVATQMECPVMDNEGHLMKILEMVDGYTLNGDTLEIHKAKMVPVAKFIAVFKK